MYKRHFLFTDNLGNNWLQFNHHLVSTQIYLYQLFFCQYNCKAIEKENTPLQMIYTHIIVLPLLL